MSKLLPSISGVACFLWVTGWTWIFSEGKQEAIPTSNRTPINIIIDSSQYLVQHPFSFDYSEATPIVDENLIPVLKSIGHQLYEKPKVKLAVVGIYSPSEDNESSFANLGIARAESIKSLLTSNGAAAEQISTSGMLADNLFEVDGKLTGVIYFNIEAQKPDNQVVAIEEKKAEASNIQSGITSFKYKYGNYKVEKEQLAFLKKLQFELQKDAEKTVVLSGYSAPEEEAASTRVNLAEMRALAIRRYLVDHGVRRSQIEVIAKPSMAKSSSEMTVNIQVVKK